ncbi:unnamed protein product [Closterium sp. Naga37s-1]|nr:unnamed protein product [Closterium sp. Naga37s-1]
MVEAPQEPDFAGHQQADDRKGGRLRMVEAPQEPACAGPLHPNGRVAGGRKRRGAEAWDSGMQQGEQGEEREGDEEEDVVEVEVEGEDVGAGALEELEMRMTALQERHLKLRRRLLG